MTTVYYNFPEIILDLNGLEKEKRSSSKLRLTGVEQPVSNIQLNNVNYSAKYFYVSGSKENADEAKYFVVECFADAKTDDSNMIYVVFPLVVDATENHKMTDIDNIIESSSNSVNLKLNKYINKDGRCVIPNSPTFPLTITLDSKSAIPIKQTVGKSFYPFGHFAKISVEKDPDGKSNAGLLQQDLDWIMSCELLTDDGPMEKTQVDPGATSTTISMCMMAIMIAGTTYLMGPTLYDEFGMRRLATDVLDGNHYSINFYWGFNLFLLAITCFGNAISLNNMNYFFIAIGLGLSYLAGTNAMVKTNIGNAEHTSIETKPNQSIFAVYRAILFGECETFMGRILKWIGFGFLIFSYLVMLGSAASGSNMTFMSFLVFYLILAALQIISILYFNKKSNASA
jgi:hypothetical protein